MKRAVGKRMESRAGVRVASLETLRRDRFKLVAANGRTVAVFFDQGSVFAVDNRCPHMGFPLNRGTVKDGILTCHWHHAKFDLAGGCTFDPFADDVTSFRTLVRDGEVWLDPTPIEEDRHDHWTRKLDESLEQNLRLVIAKSVIGLHQLDGPNEIVRRTALFGVRNRRGGWSAGLSILTTMANVLPVLDEADRPRALYHALVHTARSTAGQPANFDLEPLRTLETRPERYVDWFRRFVEVRSNSAAERALLTALHIGVPREIAANIVFGACTDHLFLDTGHVLDFANKAFELLEHIGWEHAGEILASVIPSLVSAQRMEETSAWRHPVAIPDLLGNVYEELDALIERGGGKLHRWDGHAELAQQILDGEVTDTIERMADLVEQGVPLTKLSVAVAYAAALRLVHFRITNEFNDWDTVHHSLTYANAVDQGMRRAPSNLLARGIFDGAMSVYLERFLNIPKQSMPLPTGMLPTAAELLARFDEHGQVDETAQLVVDMLASGDRDSVVRLLGHALLREDAGFHSFQVYEAGVQQYHHFAGRPEGDRILVGVARFLAAHSPTVRSTGQTFDIATRLYRGESIADK